MWSTFEVKVVLLVVGAKSESSSNTNLFRRVHMPYKYSDRIIELFFKSSRGWDKLFSLVKSSWEMLAYGGKRDWMCFLKGCIKGQRMKRWSKDSLPILQNLHLSFLVILNLNNLVLWVNISWIILHQRSLDSGLRGRLCKVFHMLV